MKCHFYVDGIFVGATGPVDVTFFREWQDVVPSRVDIKVVDPSEL